MRSSLDRKGDTAPSAREDGCSYWLTKLSGVCKRRCHWFNHGVDKTHFPVGIKREVDQRK